MYNTLLVSLLTLSVFVVVLEADPNEKGYCTYYGQYQRGQRTASGERLEPNDLTAAHKRLPYGTLVRVDVGQRSAVVRINDRGPPGRDDILDVSIAAARELLFVKRGRVRCNLTIV